MTGVSRPLTGMVSNWLISNVRGMKGTPCEGEPFAPLIQTGPGVERKHDYDTIMFLTGMLKLRIWGDRRWLRQVSGTNDRIWSVRYRWHLFSAGYRLVLCHGDTVRTGVTWCDPCGRSSAGQGSPSGRCVPANEDFTEGLASLPALEWRRRLRRR